MESLIGVALFLLGATSASFMGLVAARLYTGEPIAKGRSKCDVCGKTLSVASLVPVLSHVFSRGRARCCGSRLSPVSPASELLLGLLFVLVYLHLGLSPALPGFLIALSALTGLVLYDFAHQILPPVLLSVFVGASAATGLVAYPDFAAVVAPSAILVGGILLLIHLLSAGRAMGFSDAPLAFGLALLTGPVALSGFIYSF
ncbi:MAG TPA: prepilin peptidase, partial [Candidatus Paceibacterota bacterium]|nr:prepilin peptidase [Candidatus Paceibacterota bacterium]